MLLVTMSPIQLVPAGNINIQPSTKPENPLSPEGAFELLTSTLNNPTESRVCARRLHVAVERVQDEGLSLSTAKAIKLAKSHPVFLRASIRLLTRKRTLAEFSHLINHLLLCSCDFSVPGMFILHMPTPEWHIPDSTVFPSDLSALNQTLWLGMEFIRTTLSSMTTNKFRNIDPKVQGADCQPWPLKPDDLLPFGIQESIDALRL
ncbi:hypothetical protein FA13DRAFT_685155 [Coprinellus micaceus]|uniref:Uncharacterized protein n=1 Tax=Coprinellus micaceus TaxID=71717 RepID=A0A4Y7T4R6_COPMI|nr:hypothetical protein FA13DRAFT_685155 [Coprinellus micaceus]